jgi:iron(III) transport system ATP-binding protein
MNATGMTGIRFDQINKSFGSFTALQDIQFDIAPGELFFLLGPSGCGKTTLLRLIAGLQDPTSGRIFFGERDVTDLPTEKRQAVMCFQSYALWPHMSVADNVRFGLNVQGVSTEQRENRVAEVLKLVQLDDLAERRPNALSGGQQQRAALARALAVKPQCLLLDEPLSNLDAKLRLDMRTEIRRICKTAGVTTIYVTHDQKEALSIADRIALMNRGQIVQIGTPWELYRKPRNKFAAEFIGQTNILEGKVIEQNGETLTISTPLGSWRIASASPSRRTVTLSLRPEQIRIVDPQHAAPSAAIRVPAKMIETIFLGESAEHWVESAGLRLKVLQSPPMPTPPTELLLEFDPTQAVLLED